MNIRTPHGVREAIHNFEPSDGDLAIIDVEWKNKWIYFGHILYRPSLGIMFVSGQYDYLYYWQRVPYKLNDDAWPLPYSVNYFPWSTEKCGWDLVQCRFTQRFTLREHCGYLGGPIESVEGPDYFKLKRAMFKAV